MWWLCCVIRDWLVWNVFAVRVFYGYVLLTRMIVLLQFVLISVYQLFYHCPNWDCLVFNILCLRLYLFSVVSVFDLTSLITVAHSDAGAVVVIVRLCVVRTIIVCVCAWTCVCICGCLYKYCDAIRLVRCWVAYWLVCLLFACLFTWFCWASPLVCWLCLLSPPPPPSMGLTSWSAVFTCLASALSSVFICGIELCSSGLDMISVNYLGVWMVMGCDWRVHWRSVVCVWVLVFFGLFGSLVGLFSWFVTDSFWLLRFTVQ